MSTYQGVQHKGVHCIYVLVYACTCTVYTHHEPAHSFLLHPLLLLLLLPLHSGIVVQHSLAQSSSTDHVVAVELFEVSSMSQNTVQVLL